MIDLGQIAEVLQECAERYVLPRYKALEDHEVNTKSGPQDLVTQADLDVEAHLERVLPNLLPGSIVVGEEAISQSRSSTQILKNRNQKIWIVDPVDGTHNFVHHKREFAIMLGLVVNGEIQASWIYDVLGEVCYVAEKNSGAYVGTRKLQTSPIYNLSDITGFIGTHFFPKKYQDELKARIQQFKSTEILRCSAHEYIRMVNGAAQFGLYPRTDNVWDYIPGILLVQEAGGFVAHWDKTSFSPTDIGRERSGIIFAADEQVWDVIYDAFLKDHLD